jgi:phage tail sheath protein FI
MALVSPGVQVTVVDQSNYTPATTGSTAYILLATAQDKVAPGGTAYAAGTLAENAGEIYNITSQRELVTTFGTPLFSTTAAGAPLNGDELNEYGLLAAYSALGVSNNMYVQRADVDLAALTGTTTRPLKNPNNGTFWLDTSNSAWGVYEWDAVTSTFTNQTVLVVSDTTYLTASNTVPTTNIGAVGSYAVNVYDPKQPIFRKDRTNKWNQVGNVGWQQNTAAIYSTVTSSTFTAAAGNITINSNSSVVVGLGQTLAQVSANINAADSSNVYSWITSSGLLAIAITSTSQGNGTATLGGNTTVLSSIGLESGTYKGAAVTVGPYNSNPTWTGNLRANEGRPSGSVWNKSSALGAGLNLSVSQYSSSTLTWDPKTVNSYDTLSNASYGLDPTGGGINIPVDTVYVDYLAYSSAANTTPVLGTKLWYRKNSGAMTAVGSTATPSNPSTGDQFYVITRSNLSLANLTTFTVNIGSTETPAGLVAAIVAADIPYVTANITTSGNVSITHSQGGDIGLQDVTGTPLADVGLLSGTNIYTSDVNSSIAECTNWAPLSTDDYYFTSTQPYVAPANNTYWYYNTPSRVDIMYSNGTAWLGYQSTSTVDIRGYNLANTNSTGPIISASEPTTQDDGTALVYGDLWLDTGDLENYPALYRWQNVSGINQWVAIDLTDSTGQNGIIFADARWDTDGTTDVATGTIPSIATLAVSNYVDLDAPDPLLYPKGILLFNTRASGYNVKQYKSSYFTQAAYPGETIPSETATWLSASGFDTQNLPNFGRKAQRGVVVAALKSAIDSSTVLREDSNQFNLIACPGYPELIPNMVALNNDRDDTAFIIGDTPFRLPATGTAVQAWATNSADASATGEDGLNTSDPYVGLYYPSGQTTDLSGATVVVPPSHAVLRSILNSDNASYPWIAPAGTRRGLIDNLNSIGYVNASTGAFVTVGINQGLRDILYTNAINPITSLPGVGLVVYGQKTLATLPSALDRINVARLINYVRKQLNVLSRPFLFEPNDTITRNSMTAVCNSLMNDLVAKRGVADYLVVCDSSNNTPDRINRNELWVDIAVQPTKDVEFIYIPIRLVAAGQLNSNNVAPAEPVGTGAN